MKQATLADEAAALTRAIDLADGRLSDGPITAARQTLQKIGVRSELAPDRTVVALMGATGSGKSSLFNALVGEQLARTAATRPTTRRPLAASWGEGASELLDWLDVPERTLRPDDGSGLVLLDLPDIDSTELDHREIAHRMAEVVDVLVWVLDPQKYADAVVHQQYLQPMAAHAEVTMVVLNQADRVSEAEVASIMRDLRRLLAADGMESVEMHAVSALTGAGVDDLRTRVHAIAASKKARLARAHADLVRAARHLDAAAGGAAAGEITAQNHTRLLEASFRAAGIPAVAAAVRGSHIRRARASVGWPPIRWVARFRPDPLRRLHLDRAVSTPALARTSLPGPTPVQEAAVRANAHALVAGATRAAGHVALRHPAGGGEPHPGGGLGPRHRRGGVDLVGPHAVVVETRWESCRSSSSPPPWWARCGSEGLYVMGATCGCRRPSPPCCGRYPGPAPSSSAASGSGRCSPCSRWRSFASGPHAGRAGWRGASARPWRARSNASSSVRCGPS